MPSVIALLEVREARAREDLESWLEMLREAEVQAEAARQRLEHARIAREEVALMFAEGPGAGREGDGASPAPTVVEKPVGVAGTPPTGPVLREGYDARPPAWQPGLGADALCGAYRQVFETALAAPGPVTVQELTRALGRDAARLNEVEKVRHRAYALQARGWLLRERGLFRPAAGPGALAGTRASEDVLSPVAASG
ncbi:hypothetical protein P3T36_007931 [Kitasatospora sp. MAP12-15]|uniref:hypothetical protein n=1 Tax=Kitasatospora sp. MAP12-9 TaxID=3035100 RepID=UPI00247EEBC0|nr:hypothetical protein [Kitasatospora sp. MAP12-44]MDH6110359.1 hypothetical protein [Kitasatospora sp. MAP12-44]